MREIEFRGLNEYGDFVYGFYVQNAFDGTSRNAAHGIQSAGCYPVEIDPNTLGQYTGLKGCNGVKIFEDDILSGESKVFGQIVGIVCMSEYIDNEGYVHEEHFGWNVKGIPLVDLINDGFYVIGNTHQNSYQTEK